MKRKIAVDFGTSNTTVSYWNETLEKAEVIKMENISRRYRNPETHEYFDTYCIPSVINFDSGSILTGQEVFNRGKEFHSGTFRDIKRYIMRRKSLPKNVEGRQISFYEAGETFLREIILRTKE